MKYTEFYFMIRTYGFFILLAILGLMIIAWGLWWLLYKIKKLIRENKRNRKEKDKQ